MKMTGNEIKNLEDTILKNFEGADMGNKMIRDRLFHYALTIMKSQFDNFEDFKNYVESECDGIWNLES